MKKSKHKKKYKKYLKSDAWAEIRNDVVLMFDYTCQKCFKKTKHPQVHHLTYKNLFFEEPGDLTLLCKKCHEKIHGIKKSKLKFNKKNFKKLKAENIKFKIIIEDALKIKSLWLPGKDWKEDFKSEAIALNRMYKMFIGAIE